MSKKYTPWFASQIPADTTRPPVHLRHATDMTKYGIRNYDASPLYIRRRRAAKAKAASLAVKNMPQGNPPRLPFPHRAKGTWIYADFS